MSKALDIRFNDTGERLDLTDSDDVGIKFNYVLQDLSFFDRRGGAFTNTFKVPGTKANNLAFGQFYDPARYTQNPLFPKARAVTVTESGNTILRGTIKPKSAIVGRNSEEYEVLMTGLNMNWADQLKDMLLNSLTYPVVDYDAETIEAGWTNTYTDHYACPLVNYGRWYYWDNMLDEDFVLSREMRLSWVDFRFWLFARTMVEEMFTRCGYRLVSNFMTGDMFSKLILYFNDNDSYPQQTWDEFHPAAPISASGFNLADLIGKERTCLDLLKGIQHMFNLFFSTDEEMKVVYCEPFKDFFNGVEDWHSKESYKESEHTIFSEFKRQLWFQYQQGDSVTAAISGEKKDKVVAAGLTLPDGYEKGEDIFDNPLFGPLYMGWSRTWSDLEADISLRINKFRRSNLFMPIVWDQLAPRYAPQAYGDGYLDLYSLTRQKSASTTPRIAVFAGWTPVDVSIGGFNNYAQFNVDFNSHDHYPYAYSVDAMKYDPSGNHYNLGYNTEIATMEFLYHDIATGGLSPYGLGDGSTMDGLLRTYYMDQLASFIQGRKLTQYMNLKASDIAKLDFRKFVYSQGQKWIKLEVQKYEPLKSALTKCLFLQWAGLDRTTVGNITDGLTQLRPVPPYFPLPKEITTA